jgi:DNA-binding transcriptional MerR regulator
MEREVSDLAKYATVAQAAVACGVNERRVRNWQNLGLLKPAGRLGLIQFPLADVVRCAILLQLQTLLGQDSALAVQIARGLNPQQIESLLGSDDPGIVVEHLGCQLRVGLDPEELAITYERLAEIPR